MDWVGLAYIALLVLTVLLNLGLLFYTLARRTVPGGRPLAMLIMCMIAWSAFMLLEFVAAVFDVRLFLFNLRQITVIMMPVAWLMMTYEAYQQMLWRRWGLLLALCIFPAITLVLAVANHPVIRVHMTVSEAHGLSVIVADRGLWVVLSAAYAYLLYLGGTFFVIDAARRVQAMHRRRTQMMLMGITLILLGALSDLIGASPIAPLGIIALTFLPATLCFIWALFRYGVVDVLPMVHDRVLEAIADGVLVVDLSGRIIDINRSARDLFTGISPTHPPHVGMTLADAMAVWPQWTLDLSASGGRFEVQHGSGDDQRTFEVEVSEIAAPDERAVGHVILINDITTQKAAYDLIAERERIAVLQRFIRDASHDLRTPMSVIHSSSYLMRRLSDRQIENLAVLHPKLPQVYAAVIEEAIDLTGKVRDRTATIDDASRRLWGILSGMIELAELETLQTLDVQKVNITQLITELVQTHALECERRSITVETAFDDRITWVMADEQRMFRAVDAVVQNAIRYTEQGGTVKVSTGITGLMPCITVTDNGIGIGEEDLPRIFERFFRADPARGMETGGAGLGLALARRIVEAHGGSITVESRRGVGSTFRITIPADARVTA